MTSHFKRGQNTALIGPRRVGESSLIHRVAGAIPKSTLVYADFWGIHTVEDFVRRCIQSLDAIDDKAGLLQKISQAIPGLSVTIGLDPISGTPTLTPALASRKKTSPETIVQITRLWASLPSSKQKVIIALDEFQDFATIEHGEQISGTLRKEIQLLGEIPFCFCGSIRNDMRKISSDPVGAFYKSTAAIDVTGDDCDDWRGFLR